MIDQKENTDNNSNDKSYMDSYEKLKNRLKSIEDTLYDDPTESFNVLINICNDYCKLPKTQEKYDYRECFLKPIECICKIINKYNPPNKDKLEKSFKDFFNEDRNIKHEYKSKDDSNTDENNLSDSDSEFEDDVLLQIFDHYSTFVHILQRDIKSVEEYLPKYSYKPTDIKILSLMVVLLASIYIYIRFDLFDS